MAQQERSGGRTAQHETKARAKKTVIGMALVALGLSTMFVSPALALRLSVIAGILTYHVVFLVGFVSLLYGAGYILLANNLWGS